MNSCASAARRGLDLLARRVGPAEADVGGDRVGEEERVLEHHADVVAQRVEVDVANVDAVDRDAPGVHVVEAREHERDRRLARARAADERDRLARRDREIEVAQHRIGRRVAERHVLEAHLRRGISRSERIGRVLHDRRRVEQVVDALGAGAGELADGEDRGELADRRRDEEHVGGEREERAQRDATVEREPPAEREHRDLSEGRDGLHRGLEPGLDVHQADARGEHLARTAGQALELTLLLPEALHDPHAGHVFLDHVGDVAGLLLRVPARRGTPTCAASSR